MLDGWSGRGQANIGGSPVRPPATSGYGYVQRPLTNFSINKLTTSLVHEHYKANRKLHDYFYSARIMVSYLPKPVMSTGLLSYNSTHTFVY